MSSAASTVVPYSVFEKMAFAESARRGGCGEECVNAWMLTYQSLDRAWFALHGDDMLNLGGSILEIVPAAEQAGIWGAKLHGQNGDVLP